MESNQEETKSLLVSEESKTNAKQEGDNLKKIKDLQTFFNKLSKNQQFMLMFNRLINTKKFAQIKSIDVIKFLRGTQYSTKIEQFFEFDIVIKKFEEGFGRLQCSHPDCDLQAFMAFKGKNGEPTLQFCRIHSNHSNNSTKSPKILEFELKLHKILFYEIEIQLVYIQDRIDYIISDKNQKNMSLYAKIEDEVQRNLDSIKSTLKTTTERIYQIDDNYKTKISNKASMFNFDDFSFVKKDLAVCRESILTILSLISGPSSKNQAAFLIQVMADFKMEINLEEERNDLPDSTVPFEIYNCEYQMVNFPSQSLQSIKNFEQKLTKIFKLIEACQKNISELVESLTPCKQILQQQLDQLLREQEYNQCMKQLSLRDDQFYIDKFKLDSDKIKWFKEGFTDASDVYKKLGTFDYGQQHCTADHIRTCIKYSWIYIGEVKEGADHILHGIGIQVWRGGSIYEGYWKDGKLHGRGRNIDCNGGNYYIGDFKEGNWSGEGTYYKANGDKYIGRWDGNGGGLGEIYYADGTQYTGHWHCLKDGYFRHGLGTLYSADGQVLNEGKWDRDEYVGKE